MARQTSSVLCFINHVRKVIEVIYIYAIIQYKTTTKHKKKNQPNFVFVCVFSYIHPPPLRVHQLMKLMAPIVGAAKTREHLIDRFLEMCAVELHFVRKSCAEYFPVFCQVLGTELTEELLLPVFLRLCDDSVWGVRKTAAGSLLKVALMCTLESRRTLLAPMVYKLLNYPSRWVGMVAFESLGQFISLFAQPCITGLTYTVLGDLYIMNAANPDFK